MNHTLSYQHQSFRVEAGYNVSLIRLWPRNVRYSVFCSPCREVQSHLTIIYLHQGFDFHVLGDRRCDRILSTSDIRSKVPREVIMQRRYRHDSLAFLPFGKWWKTAKYCIGKVPFWFGLFEESLVYGSRLICFVISCHSSPCGGCLAIVVRPRQINNTDGVPMTLALILPSHPFLVAEISLLGLCKLALR